ncbi:DUF6376 family protein [Domibacillus enclensis]|nr:DUF6376 family protein [Domibacillus enclensis]
MMMKKAAAAFGLSVLLLSGCSLVDEANNTLTYATDMTEFLNETQQFASEVPALLENAASNPSLAADVEAQLENMQQQINDVQQMDAPVIAEGVHSRLLDYSTQLEEGIQEAMSKVESGVLDPAAIFENTDLLQTVQELQELRNSIEQLGQ